MSIINFGPKRNYAGLEKDPEPEAAHPTVALRSGEGDEFLVDRGIIESCASPDPRTPGTLVPGALRAEWGSVCTQRSLETYSFPGEAKQRRYLKKRTRFSLRAALQGVGPGEGLPSPGKASVGKKSPSVSNSMGRPHTIPRPLMCLPPPSQDGQPARGDSSRCARDFRSTAEGIFSPP